MIRILWAVGLALGVSSRLVWGAAPGVAPFGPNKANEPLAKEYSAQRAGAFLDHVALQWTNQRKCATCHTNVPMLWAKPALKGPASEAEKAVRAFLEQRVRHWDRGQKGDKPRWDTEVLVTAVTLAMHDAQTTGQLHATTRTALDRIWTLQRPNGAWNWLKCNWPPQEHDDAFGAVFVAVGLSYAPDNYAQTEQAKAGLAKLRGYLAKNPPPNPHHRAWLLWASARLEGLLTAEQRATIVQELRDLQKPDGGWSLPSLGDWEGFDGRDNDTNAPSDGYATGLVVLVLREAGVAKEDPAIVRGVRWLKSHQRVSGRWWTRSLNTDKAHYITHAGTAYAVMALARCAD